MSIAASLLPEFDHEMATARALLERVPEESAAWKPHDRSYSLGELAMHIATLPVLGLQMLDREEVDLDPTESMIPDFESTASMLKVFDNALRDLRAALEATPDDALRVVWSLKSGGHTFISLPRIAAYRTVFMNHLIHHRGQLSVYLRLRDVPLPSIYGPTADTQLEATQAATEDNLQRA